MDVDNIIDGNYLTGIIEYMPDAFAYHRIVSDSNGIATGYIFISVNKAFEEMTGLKRKDIIDKNITDIMPGFEKSEFNWIKTYSRVAWTGENISFKQYFKPMNKWFEISAFSEKKGYFSTVFREITEDINEKNSLEQIVDVSEVCFKNFGENYVNDKIADAVKNISGAMGVSFNIYDDDGKNFNTVAISGTPEKIKRIIEVMGFNPLNRIWVHDNRRADLIKNSKITEMQNLSELVGNVLSTKVTIILEKLFSLGKVYIAKIIKNDVMMGDFTIIMSKGKEIQNIDFVNILTGLTGQYLDRKKAQKLLITEHNKMITIFDNMEAVIYVVDMDTFEILFINNHGISELGNLTGTICWEKIHTEESGVCDFCPIEELKKQTDDNNYKKHREYFNKVSNNWYQCTDSVIRWTDGRNVKLTVSLNITNRVKLEQERYIEQEKFKTTLLSVGDAIIATDNLGDITVMNKVAEDLSEWSQEEAFGRPLEEIFHIIHERTRKRCNNPAKQVLLTGETLILANHTALVTKTGKLIPIEDSAAPIKAKDGVVRGVVIVFRDYTLKREQLKKVEFLSFNDHLTGLHNRRFMEEALKKLDKEKNLPIAVTVVDINGLKLTNDAYGHEMGDKLIVVVTNLLKNACREEDVITRTGGDEFVILHPKMDSNKTDEFKTKVKNLASKAKLDLIIVSLAVGYDVKTHISQDIYEVMRQADNRMYKDKLKSGKYMRSQTIEAVLRNINNNYDSEQIHTEKVSQYCAAIGSAMGLSAKQIDELKTVGVLHDIGKIIIPPEILKKKEKLTSSEISEIRRHPIVGYNIIKGVEEYSIFADAVLYHHERWEGKGYPSGIMGNEIPLYSRIVAVADAYEAMTSKKPYQYTKTMDEAIDELISCAGTQFDPDVVKAFVNVVLK